MTTTKTIRFDADRVTIEMPAGTRFTIHLPKSAPNWVASALARAAEARHGSMIHFPSSDKDYGVVSMDRNTSNRGTISGGVDAGAELIF